MESIYGNVAEPPELRAEDQRYGYLLLPDGRACPAGGAGGGVWGIAAGSRQAASGGFALKLHGDFYLN